MLGAWQPTGTGRPTGHHRTGIRCQAAASRHKAGNFVQCAATKPDGAGRKRSPEAAILPESLALAFERDRASAPPVKKHPQHTGLRRAPLSGGVKTATIKFDLPSPPVAVRNLVEHARFGHLCSMMSGMHHRRAGYPFGTLIDFATDGAGHPIFCLSPLAIHSRNLAEEPRASLVVQMPGWTGLANARVTIFGDVYQLPADMQAAARDIFVAKHTSERKEQWVSGNFVYFRMHHITDIYFVGGFGTVQWIDPAQYHASRPDDIVVNGVNRTLQVLNDTFADELRLLVAPDQDGHGVDELMLISIDASGADMRIQCGSEFNIERLTWPFKVHNVDEALNALRALVQEAKQQGTHAS